MNEKDTIPLKKEHQSSVFVKSQCCNREQLYLQLYIRIPDRPISFNDRKNDQLFFFRGE